ncbi:outer membrane lipid asymmetry maintenance protein MlaD [Roseomonas sp. NAR14]|uniref:Outer membrane lipid asymmetry maintenance protein MlaD n=1 Tax=Roseomonas acroporae TaxID=2937791 RepID=A0A9X1Y469_9PROT|nr:outer membrane lipid asymmetry maintenance protein MlaD [Roseomonas acroporae]
MRGRGFAETATGAVVLLIAVVFVVYALASTGRATGGGGGGLSLTARFDRIDGLQPGADVRIAGVKVGSVTSQRIDPQSFAAVLTMSVDGGLRLPTDTSAEITSEGLLGGKYVALVPGGADEILRNGSQISDTQGSVSLEALLGRFIFSVTQLASNTSRESQGAGGASGGSGGATGGGAAGAGGRSGGAAAPRRP